MLRIFFVLTALFLFSCQATTPIPQDTLVIGIEKAPESFDPRIPTDAVSQKINRLIYNGLLRKDEHLNLIPDLAERYEMTDAVTYVFFLKKNVVFHNQKKLTSTDVKATYESMLSDAIKSPFKGSLSIIKKIITPDETTIVFELKEPNTPFLTLMSLGILSADVIARDGTAEDGNPPFPVGTGPYQLTKMNHHDQDIYLIRNENYFRARAKTAKLVFRVVQDNTLRAMELIKGRIDFLQNGVPYVLIDYLKRQKHIAFQTGLGSNFTYLGFNLKNPLLKDVRVRRAVAHAIDRKKIILYKLAGLASFADSLLSSLHWAYHGDLEKYDFDPEKAKRLLDEAGFKDPDGDGPLSRFKLAYKTSSVKERVEIAQLIAENLKTIGIAVTIQSYEFGTFYRDIRQGHYDIYTLTWVGISDPDIYYYVFHSGMVPPDGANRGYYTNHELDALLEASRTEPDHERGIELYKKIQKTVYDDFVYVPLWYENNFVFAGRNVVGFTPRTDAGFVNLAETYKTPHP